MLKALSRMRGNGSLTRVLLCAASVFGVSLWSFTPAAGGTITVSTQDLPDGETVGDPIEFSTIPLVTIEGAFDGTEPLQDRSFLATWFLSQDLVDGLEVDLSAEAVFEILGFDDNELKLKISITNTVDLVELGDNIANIMSFGFGVDPDVDAVLTSPGAVFDGASSGSGSQETFPGGFKLIDVCIFSANGCSGGDVNQGLFAGESDMLEMLLTPETGIFQDSEGNHPFAELAAFPIKFQGDFGSFEFISFPDDGGGFELPLPATLWLFGAGLIGLGLAQRRRHSGTTR